MDNPAQTVVQVEEVSPAKKKLVFDVPWPDVKRELDAVYRDVNRKAKVPGFRPGKVPRPILERHYRKFAEEETASQLVSRRYEEALKDREIAAVSSPEIDQPGIEAEKNFAFSVTVEVEPVFEPQGYLGLTLEREVGAVTDEDVARRMEQIREMYATLEEVADDRPATQGDFVSIDFAGSLEGQALPELQAKNHFLELGAGTFVPGFEDQLLGMAKGETREVRVRMPEAYRVPKLAGKDVAFVVTLQGIRQKKLPPLDGEFVKNFEKYMTLEDLRADVRRGLEDQMRQQDDLAFRRKLVDAILQANDVEAPPSYVERQIFLMMADAHNRMTAGGMDEKQAANLSLSLHDRLRDDAARAVKSALVLREIARKEGLAVEDDELEAHLRDLARRNGRPYEEVCRVLEKEDRIEAMRRELLQDKVVRLVTERATITQVERRTQEVDNGPDSHGD